MPDVIHNNVMEEHKPNILGNNTCWYTFSNIPSKPTRAVRPKCQSLIRGTDGNFHFARISILAMGKVQRHCFPWALEKYPEAVNMLDCFFCLWLRTMQYPSHCKTVCVLWAEFCINSEAPPASVKVLHGHAKGLYRISTPRSSALDEHGPDFLLGDLGWVCLSSPRHLQHRHPPFSRSSCAPFTVGREQWGPLLHNSSDAHRTSALR